MSLLVGFYWSRVPQSPTSLNSFVLYDGIGESSWVSVRTGADGESSECNCTAVLVHHVLDLVQLYVLHVHVVELAVF